jgi:hypothetical protein
MSPSILVQDRNTDDFVKVFTKSEQLVSFLTSEEKSGVDIKSKYLIYNFSVDKIFSSNEALDTIQNFGYLATNSEYED